MGKTMEVDSLKYCIETIEIQILECTFCVPGLNYGEPNPNHNVNAFIKTLTDYLWSLPEEEREEYFEILKPGCFDISEVTSLSFSKTGTSSHRGLRLKFRLVSEEKGNLIYVPGWKSKSIHLVKRMIEEKAITNIIGTPLIYVFGKDGKQILYK